MTILKNILLFIPRLVLRLIGLGSFGDNPNKADAKLKDGKQDQDYLHIPSLLASIFYLIVIFCIGVPVWFWTCSVARHPLPDVKLLVNNDQSRLKLDISVVLMDRSQQKDSSEKYAKSLRELLPGTERSANNLYYDFHWRVRRPLPEELQIFMRAQENTNDNREENLKTVEKDLLAIHAENNRFRLWLYIIDEQQYDKYCQRAHSFTFGFERFVFVCPSTIVAEKDRPQSSSRLIMDAIRETYLNSIDKKRINYLLSSELDLIVNMIAEDDNEIRDIDELGVKSQKVHNIIKKNVRELYPELTELVNIKLKSQLIFNSFDKKILDQALVKQSTTNQTSNNYRLFDIKKSRQFINSVRSRISDHQENHIYHLLLLSPSIGLPQILFHQPARSFDEAQLNKQSLLVSSDFNSMLIWNSDKDLILGLRTLYRHILGFTHANIHSQCYKRNIFFTKWEIDSLLAVMTITKLSKTSKSLESIKDLADKVSNIVIEREIADKMEQASKLCLQSISSIESGDIVSAYRLSSRAYELSESAFFDPSLLELLYFPHDQKYAIYFPLFMPLSFPIGFSIFRLIKSYFVYRKQSRSIIKDKQS